MKYSDINAGMVSFTPQGEIRLDDGRFVLISAESLGALRKELFDTLGKKLAMGIFIRYGYSSGYKDALTLKNKHIWDTDEDWMRAGPMLHTLEGVAEVETKKLNFDKDAGLFFMEGLWRGSYEAEEHIRYFGISGEPVCWTLIGYASGYCSAFMGRDVICLETSCEAMGHGECRFTIKTKDQWGSEINDIIEALRPISIEENISYLEKAIREKTTALEEYSKGLEEMVRNRTRELNREKELARSIIETSNMFIAATDVKGKITLFNKGAQVISGYDKDEVQGSDFYRVFYPEEMHKKRDEYIELLIKSAYPRTVDEPIVGRDGNEIIISWSEASLRNEFGDIIGVIWFGMDVTDKKLLETELIRSKNEAELYIDILSHDINNMNQVSLGYLEVAESSVKSTDTETASQISQAISAIRKSSALIDSVKKIQQIRHLSEAYTKIDLDRVISDSIEPFKDIINKKVTINFEHAPGSFINATPIIGEIFTNLLDNSIKYSWDTVTIWIRIAGIMEGDRLCYRIIYEDDGKGIDDEAKKRLFYMFTKCGRKSMGLYIIKSLVDKFYGKISVEDRIPGDYGKGAKFLITLPAADK